jgi:transcriptional regulator with XRE-family HTH domain
VPGKPKADDGLRERPTARGVRASRAWADLTAQQLADRLGVGIRTVQRWERGENVPDDSQLTAVAEHCNVPPWLAHGQTDHLIWGTR